jgi:tetratricopeptide (TPR) repeat protein
LVGDPRPGERIGAYEVIRPVARGGMASVLAVRHLETGEQCGMKLLLPLTGSEDAATRFRREFRALSRLKHSNILDVYEWGMHGDRPWFTMELLEGRDLRAELRTWQDLEPPDRYARVEEVLLQVTRALAYVHDRGLVHRDVTPTNIMVLPDGRVKVMDFGVVKDLGAELTQVGEVIGTVAYIAPEQIVGDAVDARADLYSLGTVLYLMLTGKRPFTAPTLQGYLEKHLHEMPRSPREVEPLVPEILDRVCMRLLSKAPLDRYASAVHLLNVLGAGEDAEEIEDRWPPRSVGRTYQKARMREALDDLAAGHGGAALLLTAGAGQGKTRMLDVAETYARQRGLIVARGRCRPHDRPFGAFVGVYRALAEPDAPALLHAVMEGEDDEVGHERYPVMAAFRDLIVSRAPCVVLVDDLEKADPATVELVSYLVRNTLELANEPVDFLLTHEHKEGVESLAERQLLESPPVERLVLGPLEPSEVEELVLSVLPNEPASVSLANRLHEESGGSPAFITDMLRGLIDEEVIVRDGERYRLTLNAHEITRSRLPIPASVRQAIEDRLAPLTADAREVARVLAISRRALDLDALVEAAPLDDEERVMECLDVLLEAGIIEERRAADVEQVELAQARYRDVLSERMDPAGRRDRHQRLGEVLERAYRHRPAVMVEELAYHFEQAGLAPKAYAFLAQTATRHLNRGLHEESLAFINRALRMEATARPLMVLDLADRRLAEAHLARGQALYHLGDWVEALNSVRIAEGLARDVRDARLQSRVQAELGLQLRNQGVLDEAETALREALAKADEVGDPSLRPMPMYQLGALLWNHGDLPEAERLWRQVLTIAQQAGNERMLGYGYNGLGILAASQGDTIGARSHLEHSAGLFEELGMLGALAIAQVNLVELYLSTGLLKKALDLADRTVARAREVNHPHGIGLGLAYRAQVLLAMGRSNQAQRNALEALRIVRELGTTDDEVVVLGTLVRVHLVCDDPESALRRVEELRPLLQARDTEGRISQVEAWHATALTALGHGEEATSLLEEGTEESRQWPHFQVRIDLARARAWRLLERLDRARTIATAALESAEGNGYRFFQLMAHHELSLVASDPQVRARHARLANALARSLAASLPRDDGARFLAQAWDKPVA